MAHWDKETFGTVKLPAEQCKACVYALKAVTVRGVDYERYAYGNCDKYELKPTGVLWDEAKCPEFKEKDVDTNQRNR